jgi:ferric-dicitrate binding protein FerR (iron transport regulator)
MSYKDFAPEDFAADEFFIRWIKAPDSETEMFWKDYLSRYPQQKEIIGEARELVMLVQIGENMPSQQQVDHIRRNLHRRIGRKEKQVPFYQKKPNRAPVAWYQSWQRIAAVFTGLILFCALAWYGIKKFSTVEYRTAFGQMQTIQLPDGSLITLNANSSLSYNRFWHTQNGREVCLEGEAFFQVKHLKDQSKFRVHTKENLTVEVLGTSFNVFERKSGTRVILKTGKVKLNIDHGKEHTEVFMQPGDLVELDDVAGKYARKQVNPELASAWTEHKLIFDDTPIAEIVSILEETYGLRVTVSDPELLQKKVVGSAPTGDVAVFLAALSKSFGLQIQKDGKKVIISSR